MATFKKRVIFLISAAMTIATVMPAQQSPASADKALYDTGIADIEHGDYAAARVALNTLINTYAGSTWEARAKLAIAVSWLRQGDPRALAMAEAEYRDFIRFYPAMKQEADLQVGEPLRKIREQQAATPR